MLVIPSFNVLSAYFYVSLNLVSVSTVLLIMSFDKIPDSPGNRRKEAGSKGGTAFSCFCLFQFPFAFMACSLSLVLSSLKSTSWKETTHSLSSSILSVFFSRLGRT